MTKTATLRFEQIEAAAQKLSGQILRTPTLPAAPLSRLTGAQVYVKYENMQATGAFKERGALIKLLTLTPQQRQNGIIAMSAGNHAQAVAYHGHRLNIPTTIVMPLTTPHIKIANTRAHGAQVILEGETLSDSQKFCETLIKERNLTLVHPYDDINIIAGQGTVGLEMLTDVPDLDVIVVPVGGGGLAAGVAVAARHLSPKIKIIGVEARLFPSVWNALYHDELPIGGSTLAEGIAVQNLGHQTLPLLKTYLDRVVLVGESTLERAVNAFATRLHTMAEGAGAAGLAAMLDDPEAFAGRKVGLILCGGNIDARILSSIMLRELEREQRILSFRLNGADRPGMLGDIATQLGELGANILEVAHNRVLLDVPAKGVSIDFTVETRDAAHAQTVLHAMAAEGWKPQRLDPRTNVSDNGAR